MRRWRAARNRPRQARPKRSSGRRQKALAAFVGNLGDAASRGQVPRRLHARGSLFRLSRAPSCRRRNASGVESRPGSKHVEVAHDHLRHWLCTAPIVSVPIKIPASADAMLSSELGNRYAATRVLSGSSAAPRRPGRLRCTRSRRRGTATESLLCLSSLVSLI